MNRNQIIILSLLLNLIISIKLIAENQTYINSKNIIFDEEKNTIELKENTKINIEDNNISFNNGIIDYENNNFEILSEFYLSNQSTILKGSYLNGNLNLNNFRANNVSFIYEEEFKIDSESLLKNGNDIIFYNNFITACKLDGYFNCPTWSFRIKETKYNVKEDKFEHFGSFLNIADFKVLYLPYFSHYGKKADRKRGFLNPSSEFVIGKSGSLSFPYYLPYNSSTALTITPNFIFSDTLEITENFSLLSELNQINDRGYYKISLENIKKEEEASIYSNWTVDVKQVLDKNSIIKAEALLTNSNSMSRSLNEEPITFADLEISYDRYNAFKKNDFSKIQLSTVEAFDQINIDLIPIKSSIYYENDIRLGNKSNLFNQINLINLSRNNSTNSLPSENLILNIDNIFLSKSLFKNYINKNKILLSNNFYNYKFTNDPTLNRNENKSFFAISSEYNFPIYNHSDLLLKGIHNHNIIKNNNTINEASNSVAFNYFNQLNENRNYGNDANNNSTRLVYGIDSRVEILKQNIEFKLNQSYDFKLNDDYLDTINQTNNFSDYALELNLDLNKLKLNAHTRIDNEKIRNKEVNYKLIYEDKFNFIAEYNETDKDAFKNKSNDSKSLDINLNNNIGKNISYSLKSTLDLKNNYSPFSNKLMLSFFDECSELEIFYENSRFNDNFNTLPEEIIGINFSFDYINYFEIENRSSLIK